MNSCYITPTTNNSLFAVMKNPELRFTLTDRIFQQTSALEKPVNLAINLYYVIRDALSYGTLWNDIGFRYEDIVSCRQALHDFGENTSTNRIKLITRLREFVLFLNKQLIAITLLLNDSKVNSIVLNLTVTESLQEKFAEVLESCEDRPKIHGLYGYCHMHGLSRNILRKGINIITPEDIEEIAVFLQQPENGGLLTEIYTTYIGGLQNGNLRCINTKALINAFFGNNHVVKTVIAEMYLSYNNIAFISPL